jgi:integrase
MATLMIVTRRAKDGPRYVVRYRLGCRSYPVVHAGSFKTLKDAKVRRDLVAGELAAGRNPAEVLHVLTDQPKRKTFGEWAEAYRASRVDLAGATKTNVLFHLKTMTTFTDRAPAMISVADVQEWIAGLDLKASTIRLYLSTLKQLLDFAGVDPNPARDRRLRLPRQERAVVEPPSAQDVDMIIATVGKRWRLPLRTLEQTGMRVGELQALEWGDVDEQGSRFRIKNGKTAAARRWVAVPDWLMAEIADTCPREDRTPERPVFMGFNPVAVKSVMARACKAAGIAHFHPHDLRHRYASVKIAEGVPVTIVAAQLGHSRKSLTIDTYSHVLLDERR